MIPYVFHPAALEEWRQALAYYASVEARLAGEFESAVVDYRIRVCLNPLHFRVRKLKVRGANLAPPFNEW